METSFDILEKTVMDLSAALKEAQDLAKKALEQRDAFRRVLESVQAHALVSPDTASARGMAWRLPYSVMEQVGRALEAK